MEDLNGEEIVGTSYVKEQSETNQAEFRTEKAIWNKDDKLYVKWTDCKGLICGSIKKYRCIKWVIYQYHIAIAKKIKFELDLSNYATESDLKDLKGITVTGSDTLKVA